MKAFLAFLSQDIETAPHQVALLDEDLTSRIDALVSEVEVSSDEDLGDEVDL